MQRLEVCGAVRPIYGSLGVKRLMNIRPSRSRIVICGQTAGRTDRNDEANSHFSPSGERAQKLWWYDIVFWVIGDNASYLRFILQSSKLNRGQNWAIKIACTFRGWRKALLNFLIATPLNNSCVLFAINGRNSAFWNTENPNSFKNSLQTFYTKHKHNKLIVSIRSRV